MKAKWNWLLIYQQCQRRQGWFKIFLIKCICSKSSITSCIYIYFSLNVFENCHTFFYLKQEQGDFSWVSSAWRTHDSAPWSCRVRAAPASRRCLRCSWTTTRAALHSACHVSERGDEGVDNAKGWGISETEKRGVPGGFLWTLLKMLIDNHPDHPGRSKMYLVIQSWTSVW